MRETGTFREMEFVDLLTANPARRAEAAGILRRAFEAIPGAWDTDEDAEAEIRRFVSGPDECVAIAAVEADRAIGWIGGVRYSAHHWEVHPLAVDPAHQGRGVGTSLLAALERKGRDAGVLTFFLGSDDVTGATNLHGRDLHADPIRALSEFRLVKPHPIGFYLRHGYAVCGVIPDASGPGRPDVMLAKPIAASTAG